MARPDPEWLIGGVLPAGGLAVLSAPPAHYKSFIGLDMAASVATGRDWAGRPVKHGTALYVAGEGSHGMKKRAAAWSRDRGATPDRLFLIPQAVQLSEPAQLDLLLAAMDGTRPRLVIVDTLSRTLAGKDENSQKDMSLYVDAAGRIADASGATVLILHHHNREGKIRGSTVLSGALDTEMELRPFDQDTTELRCGKQKDFEPFHPLYFRRRGVALDGGQDSLVFDPCSAPALSRSQGPTLTAPQTAALTILRGRGELTKAEWRAACPGIEKATFYRAAKDLQAAGLVQGGENGRYAAVPDA